MNWDSLTRGPIGITGIPPLSLFGWQLTGVREVYWFTLAVLVLLALLQVRLLRSHLGRTWRAIREDDVAARIDEPAHSLSYANRRRVEIARALALRPRILLLDEPTAGMNESETAECSN